LVGGFVSPSGGLVGDFDESVIGVMGTKLKMLPPVTWSRRPATSGRLQNSMN